MAIPRAACLALATAALVAFLGGGAPGSARAASLTGAEVQTATDLLNLCADPSDAAKVGCRFYIHGALQASQMMHAADRGGEFTPMFCPPENLSSDDLVTALRKQVADHQERRTFPAATVIIGGAIEAYPCTKIPSSAATSGPAASRHHRRRHKTKPKP